MPVSLASTRRHAAAELGMRVDAGADGRAAGRQFEHRVLSLRGPLDRQFDLPGEAADFLAQPQRRGVGQMRAADLDDLVPLLGLVGQHAVQPLKRRDQVLFDRRGHGHVDRRGKHVVGALPHVDVIVGMDRLFGLQPIAAQQLDGPVADHLVGVHVARRARAGLKDVDRELVVELAVGHFAAGRQQGLDLLGVERVLAGAGQLAQVAIGDAAANFTSPRPWINAGGSCQPEIGKVFDGPLRLRTVIGLGRHADLAHRILLDAEICHRIATSRRRKQIGKEPGSRTWFVDGGSGAANPAPINSFEQRL